MYTPPVTPWKLVPPEVVDLTNKMEESAYGVTSNYGEVVTRYPYWKVWIGIPPFKDKRLFALANFNF